MTVLGLGLGEIQTRKVRKGMDKLHLFHGLVTALRMSPRWMRSRRSDFWCELAIVGVILWLLLATGWIHAENIDRHEFKGAIDSVNGHLSYDDDRINAMSRKLDDVSSTVSKMEGALGAVGALAAGSIALKWKKG